MFEQTVTTTCPKCFNNTNETIGKHRLKGFYVRDNDVESDVETESIIECDICHAKFAYRLVIKIECDTAEINF